MHRRMLEKGNAAKRFGQRGLHICRTSLSVLLPHDPGPVLARLSREVVVIERVVVVLEVVSSVLSVCVLIVVPACRHIVGYPHDGQSCDEAPNH
jgi:hypothetical protein